MDYQQSILDISKTSANNSPMMNHDIAVLYRQVVVCIAILQSQVCKICQNFEYCDIFALPSLTELFS